MNEVKKSIREYSYSNDTGDAQAVVYHLFPGVEAAYISVHMTDFDFSLFEQGDRKNYVTIHYCKEGRIEQQVNDEFFYLMPGDCSFAIHNKKRKMFQLPLKHYHGISIGIDLDCMQNPLMIYAESCDCSPVDASWETIITLNPEYMFILDRSTATEAADENIMGAREVIENDLIKELDVYKNGKIVYFIEHANVWYTSTGGVQALNTMLADMESALLN